MEDVSDHTYLVDGLAIKLTPASPWLGHQVRWDMSGHLKESVDLTRATCNVIMKFGPVKMLDKTYTLPDLLKRLGARLSGDHSPPPGPWRQTWNLRLPETVPVAEHRILLRARTGSGKNLLALDIALNFSHRFRPPITSGRAGSRIPDTADCR
ncbi:hypothetical protein [Streptomyces bungoensis]|uniref:hypothetical protein n=1 Tax=Streptomyces bungoensis TaxID=285568 RepID=UPI001FCA20BE|nr:hypothetical protein [Streptomyces bungoensis]